MATVTRENIGLLNDKLTVIISKADYYNGFEQSIKKYAKTANIPGFRKGLVPSGLVKKMFGQPVFNEEVLRNVDKSLNEYLTAEKLEIFAQPLPIESDIKALDMNLSKDYSFSFEIGLKPEFKLDPKKIMVTRYLVTVTDEMVNKEVEHLQIQHGKMTDPEAVAVEDNVLNVKFVESDKDGNEVEGGISKDNSLLVKYFAEAVRPSLIGKKKDESLVLQLKEAFDDKELDFILSDLGLNKENAEDADKYFKIIITKVGLVEKAELDEAFFTAAYPGKEIKTEEEFRAAVKADIETNFVAQSLNQLHDQIYHHLLDHIQIELPSAFLKRWLQTGGETPKTEAEAEAEYPNFADQLKWTLISTQLITDNKIEVLPDDLHNFAKQQLFQYMGGQLGALGDNQQWVDDYTNRMMQDKKFVEDSYHRISTEKMFEALTSQVTATEEAISVEDFAGKIHHHQH
jgi:trigger factor